MKTSHIIILVVIAIAAAIIVSTFDNASTYVTFSEAEKLALDGDDNEIHVVGELTKDEFGNIVGLEYEPTTDPNKTYFNLIDDSLRVERVVLLKPKPQDIEKSEKIVVIGSYKDKIFVAKDILMKCPSKYNETQIKE